MTYSKGSAFIETPVFTEDVSRLLTTDAYRALQLALFLRPEAGSVIKGGGGLRKLRWRTAGRGKRGGVRVIYYWIQDENTIFMLSIYPKSRKDDLTPRQLRVLRQLVEEELK